MHEVAEMNLGEALLELKAKRSELVRLQELRENSFKFRQGGKKPEEKFENLNAEIAKLIAEIRKLKMRIENANHTRFIDAPEGRMSIAEAIHHVADMRSELACLQKLKEEYREKDRWMRDDDTANYEFQVPQRELLKTINDLEAKKVRMDAFLSAWNWKADVAE